MKTCKKCSFKTKNISDPLNIKSFLCVRFPPTIIPVVTQGTVGINLNISCSYPPITDDTLACGEFKDGLSVITE